MNPAVKMVELRTSEIILACVCIRLKSLLCFKLSYSNCSIAIENNEFLVLIYLEFFTGNELNHNCSQLDSCYSQTIKWKY